MRVLHFLQPYENRGGDPLAHIFDLARAQAEAGYDVGIVCIGASTNSRTTHNPDRIEKFCQLGFLQLPKDRASAFSKFTTTLPAYKEAVRFVQGLVADRSLDKLILHGHGESGGDLARHVQKTLPRRKARTICVYSPHGTVFQNNTTGWPFSSSQKKMWRHTHGIIFNSSAYQQDYTKQFGSPSCLTNLIYDGLIEDEFAPRPILDMASDFLFVGEMSRHTGIELLINALARMKKDYRTGALIVGSGQHKNELRAQVDRYGLAHEIFFNAPLNARSAFLKGGCLILPTRITSIPYIALQAAAAGMPMILTNKEGIPELTGEIKMPLIQPDDAGALQEQLIAYLTNPQPFLARAAALKQRVALHFTMERMGEETEQFYLGLLKGKR